MSKSIFKYPLAFPDRFITYADMPKGAQLLHVHEQVGAICVWAEVSTENAEMEARTFEVIGTGHFKQVTDRHRYIGTAHVKGYVWHVYEIQ